MISRLFRVTSLCVVCCGVSLASHDAHAGPRRLRALERGAAFQFEAEVLSCKLSPAPHFSSSVKQLRLRVIGMRGRRSVARVLVCSHDCGEVEPTRVDRSELVHGTLVRVDALRQSRSVPYAQEIARVTEEEPTPAPTSTPIPPTHTPRSTPTRSVTPPPKTKTPTPPTAIPTAIRTVIPTIQPTPIATSTPRVSTPTPRPTRTPIPPTPTGTATPRIPTATPIPRTPTPTATASEMRLFLTTLTPQGSAGTSASGVSSLRLYEGSRVALIAFSYSNLTAPRSAIHIHGPGGIVLLDIDDLRPDAEGVYRWEIRDIPQYTAEEVIALIKRGEAYLNVHTATYPGGEISGNYILQR